MGKGETACEHKNFRSILSEKLLCTGRMAIMKLKQGIRRFCFVVNTSRYLTRR